MPRLEVELVDDSGKIVGFGDRWWTHRVKEGPNGPILGRRHVGITIACIDEAGRILVAFRRHKIFNRVWTLSGDTHPYRVYGEQEIESLGQAARRCAMDDLGIETRGWTKRLTCTYSARDPRNPKYCENELLHVMVTTYQGPLDMNPKNVYELRWVELSEISNQSKADLRKEPIDRKYAPWIHAMFALKTSEVRKALRRA